MSDCLCLDCKKNSNPLLDSVKFRSEKRRKLLTKIIEKNPGIQFRDIMRQTKLKNGVLSHHLRILEKTESIQVERAPQQTRFYPRNFSEEESKVAKALRRKTPRDIILTLMLNDVKDNDKNGIEFSQIVDSISKSPSTVSIYLSQLLKDRIVKMTLGYDHKKRYHLLNKKLIDRLIEDHKPGRLDKSVSGFEDMINSL